MTVPFGRLLHAWCWGAEKSASVFGVIRSSTTVSHATPGSAATTEAQVPPTGSSGIQSTAPQEFMNEITDGLRLNEDVVPVPRSLS